MSELYAIEEIPGLYYAENLLSEIPTLPNAWVPLTSAKTSREVQHYGFQYNYATYSIKEPAPPLPQSLEPLQITITVLCKKYAIISPDYIFNQCIVNKYEKRQGISAHTDVRSYGTALHWGS